MSFLDWYRNLSENKKCSDEMEEKNNLEDVDCNDPIEDDDEYDDEWSAFSDCDIEECNLQERLIRKVVFRNGKRVIKFKTDKENYRVQMVNGIPREVRMSPSEVMKRKRAQKLASRKRKSGQQMSIAKRNRTMTKRKTSNI